MLNSKAKGIFPDLHAHITQTRARKP